MTQKHIVHVFHGFRVGGSERRTCQIINGMGDGYRHTIVALNGEFAAADLIEHQAGVTLLHPPDFQNRSFLANALASRRWLKHLRPDLLIVYSWGGFEWLLGNSLRKVCADVFSIEGFNADESAGELRHRWMLRRVIANRCTAIHACSTGLRNLAVESWSAAAGRVEYIPNGVDTGMFRPGPPKRRERRVVLGIVASLSAVKNHLLLLEAFCRLPPGAAELHIVGEGPEREPITRFVSAHSLGDRVTLAGYRSDTDHLLRDMDVFCLSSRSEQMPIAVLEAMATGLPVVSTDVGDVRQMLSGENAPFVVPPGDTRAYADALLHLVLDEGARRSLGARNRLRCEAEFSLSSMIARHEELYTRCASAYAALRETHWTNMERGGTAPLAAGDERRDRN